MNFNRYKYIYVFIDYISALVALTLFYKYEVKDSVYLLMGTISSSSWNFKILICLIILPFFWLTIYKSSGYYDQPLRKFHIEDIGKSIIQSLFGVSVLIIMYIFYNSSGSYNNYFQMFVVLFLIHFLITVIPRFLFTSFLIRQKMAGKIFFNVLFVGRNKLIGPMWTELNNNYAKQGNRFLGYVSVDEPSSIMHVEKLDRLGELNNLTELVEKNKINDVIIVLHENDLDIYKKVLLQLNGTKVVVKINTELYPLLMGRSDVSSLFNFPLIQITRNAFSPTKLAIKRLIDIVVSFSAILLTIPLVIPLILIIIFTSKGSFLYSQQRVGRNGKLFSIYKFRSMYQNAESDGPRLATKNDTRITWIGAFMRRLRLDEIPNFLNVLKGDMSLVGPRPERRFYIDQILARAPEYYNLLQVKPGVTSWGQVKYGYAENIDEMIKRMSYDLLYIENMSFYVDLQILYRTIFIILQGRGV